MKQHAVHSPVAVQLAALSEPLRLRICRLLEDHELSVGEVAKVVQLPQSTVSRHLKVLSEAGWLQKRAEGTATMYRLLPDELEAGERNLWLAVRNQFAGDPSEDEDQRRLEGVLADRRTDSLSFFGRVAGEWDQVRNELFGREFTSMALLALLPREWAVADLGCGTGNGAELIARHVRKVIAIDQSRPMLDAARKRLCGFDNIEFVQGPLEALPLADASVDAAICLLVLHHVSEPAEALREMRRVVRPGGAVLVVDMFEHDRTIYKHTMGHAHLGFSESEILRHFKDAGFDRPTIASLPSDSNARGPGLFAVIGTVGEGPQ